MFEVLSGVGLLCVVWGIVAALLMARDLERRGISVNYIWLRFFIPDPRRKMVDMKRTESRLGFNAAWSMAVGGMIGGGNPRSRRNTHGSRRGCQSLVPVHVHRRMQTRVPSAGGLCCFAT